MWRVTPELESFLTRVGCIKMYSSGEGNRNFVVWTYFDLSSADKASISGRLPPDSKVEFYVGPDPEMIKNLLKVLENGRILLKVFRSNNNHHVLEIVSSDERPEVLNFIAGVLMRDSYIQKVMFYQQNTGELLASSHDKLEEMIEAFNKVASELVRKQIFTRETVITQDDILNLKISLELMKDVNDLLKTA